MVIVAFFLFFFFFQAEDGIRDYKVTGVQTCALPICASAERGAVHAVRDGLGERHAAGLLVHRPESVQRRSRLLAEHGGQLAAAEHRPLGPERVLPTEQLPIDHHVRRSGRRQHQRRRTGYWVAVSPTKSKRGYVSTTLYQHQSTLRLMIKGLGVTSFPSDAATAPDMSEFFTP